MLFTLAERHVFALSAKLEKFLTDVKNNRNNFWTTDDIDSFIRADNIAQRREPHRP